MLELRTQQLGPEKITIITLINMLTVHYKEAETPATSCTWTADIHCHVSMICALGLNPLEHSVNNLKHHLA